MQKLIVVILFALFSQGLLAQSNAIDALIDKYESREEVSTLNLQGWLFNLVANADDDEETTGVSAKINHIQLMVMDEQNLVSPKEMKRFKSAIYKDQYEPLFQIREEKNLVEFLLREEGDLITDVLILVSGKEDFVLLNLSGQLKFSDLNDLDIQVEGGDHFKKIPENRRDVPRA
ncbi:MAG: DUF4252 domain-containing protein [Bacteroidota bacterium]